MPFPKGQSLWARQVGLGDLSLVDANPLRFMAKVEVVGDCWLWRAGRFGNGYGRFKFEGRDQPAHRVAYKLFVGPIPDGLDLDHLCRVILCVRPAHLEPVTRYENLIRGDTLIAAQVRATHCPWGHSYDEANTYITKQGARRCRACWKRQRQKA